MGIWSIDGVEWTIPCQIKRISKVDASEISGLMLNKAYFNDVLGTYLQYDVAIAVPKGMENQYYQVHDLLSHPTNSHTFVMPYNGTTVTFTGKVEEISDEWVRIRNNKWTWKGVRFTAKSLTPTRAVSMGMLDSYGISPYPDESDSAEIGDTYQLTDSGWVKDSTYIDGDEVRW